MGKVVGRGRLLSRFTRKNLRHYSQVISPWNKGQPALNPASSVKSRQAWHILMCRIARSFDEPKEFPYIPESRDLRLVMCRSIVLELSSIAVAITKGENIDAISIQKRFSDRAGAAYLFKPGDVNIKSCKSALVIPDPILLSATLWGRTLCSGFNYSPRLNVRQALIGRLTDSLPVYHLLPSRFNAGRYRQLMGSSCRGRHVRNDNSGLKRVVKDALPNLASSGGELFKVTGISPCRSSDEAPSTANRLRKFKSSSPDSYCNLAEIGSSTEPVANLLRFLSPHASYPVCRFHRNTYPLCKSGISARSSHERTPDVSSEFPLPPIKKNNETDPASVEMRHNAVYHRQFAAATTTQGGTEQSTRD
ncbi:hypothetical protein J6590_067651 [Homalodisca vitripennis]|nr:hypothetical protein J6590_067651 [Homalodisca vitripennis]